MGLAKELLLQKLLADNTGGGSAGGGLQCVSVDSETMTCEKSSSEIIAMLQIAPVFLFLNGQYALLIPAVDLDGETAIVKTSLIDVMGDSVGMVISITIREDKSVGFAVMTFAGESME